MLSSIESRLSKKLAAKPRQVAAAIALLDEGATVPFIARYRKEATGGSCRPKVSGNPRQMAVSIVAPSGGAMATAFADLKARDGG